MPKGITSQFIVQMYRYIKNHNNVWGRGVILERDDTWAEIIETYDARNINIRIRGKHRRDLMTIITEKIDQINQQYEKMKVEKKIPCNCFKCREKNSVPWFFRHTDLQRRLENGVFEIQCEISYAKVNVRGLIDEVLNEAPRAPVYAPKASEQDTKTFTPLRDSVFICYNEADMQVLTRIQIHLKTIENQGIHIKTWDNTKIEPGMETKTEIRRALSSCKVAVLIVSTDFLASETIIRFELPALLQAAESEGAIILPLIAKPCRYAKNPALSVFQPVTETPLSRMPPDDQEEILIQLIDQIEAIFEV